MAHRRWVTLAVALQLLILAGIAGAKQWTLMTGTVILLETAPVDPRDLFRGDYVVLNYRISTLKPRGLAAPTLSPWPFYPGYTAYVGLERRGQFWEAASIDVSRPSGLFIRGTVRSSDERQDVVRVAYGIESYFVPEGLGRRIETRRSLAVEVALSKGGTAIIRRLMIDGQPVR